VIFLIRSLATSSDMAMATSAADAAFCPELSW